MNNLLLCFLKVISGQSETLFCLYFSLFKKFYLFFCFQLDDICTGDKPDLKELKPAQQGDLTDFLQLLGCSLQSELSLQKSQPQDDGLLSAAHLLISAISGML